ncbi:hypothetical protein Hanom_Chr08g00746031 [Helianthus anomalus]
MVIACLHTLIAHCSIPYRKLKRLSETENWWPFKFGGSRPRTRFNNLLGRL